MSIQGQAILQFGAGGSDKVTVTVSSATYVNTMLTEAWVNTAATAIYSQDEMTMLVTSGSLIVSIPESQKAAGQFVIVGSAYNGYISGNIAVNWVAN
jgi:hypothetical protein